VTPEQAAHDLAATIVGVPGRFMTDPATFEHGASLGFDGMDFYIAGRAGPLGDVTADVVTASLVFFAAEVVRPAWDRSATVMSRHDAAREWLERGRTWAEEHFGDGPDYARAAELLGRVVRDASVAAAPLFAAIRGFDEPDTPRAIAHRRMYALRELRGALHGAAILTVGLTPLEAITVRSPAVAGLFGWGDTTPAVEPLRDRWQLAEARTDRMAGRQLAVLDAAERAELVEIGAAISAALR
jgi:hypothetical protein